MILIYVIILVLDNNFILSGIRSNILINIITDNDKDIQKHINSSFFLILKNINILPNIVDNPAIKDSNIECNKVFIINYIM